MTATEDLLAVKRNLCNNTPLNPAGAQHHVYSCQENCPTGALVRVNPKEYFAEAKSAVGLIYRDQTHAIGRNIHKSDPVARLFHIFGVWEYSCYDTLLFGRRENIHSMDDWATRG